jgi:hypothetical protein
MIFLNVILCRKYDSTLDFEVDNKDYTNDFNHTKKSNLKSRKIDFNYEETIQICDDDDLKEMRQIRLLEIKFWSILNELGVYLVFWFLLYVVSFFNLNNSSFVYNQLFLNTFVNRQSLDEIGLYDVIKKTFFTNLENFLRKIRKYKKIRKYFTHRQKITSAQDYFFTPYYGSH